MPQFTENYKNKNRRSSNLELLRLNILVLLFIDHKTLQNDSTFSV